ncbi:MAG TPA: dioxygenase [Acetobacteraceae bacterium]|nr:dioxygenase [Acetobacteraceae bacterium]
MILDDESQVTDAVLAAFADTPDARLRTVMTSLIRHVHAFLREVRPTEEEYYRGLQFIAELGKNTGADRNETIIAADTLGFSTLATLLNNTIGAHRTDPALLGPFWRKHAPHRNNGESIAYSPTPGPAVFVSGRVMDTSGAPIAGALVDVWHASPIGFYENQDPDQADYNLRGVFTADADGRYSFRTAKPAGYPVPVDGPVGELLKATRRHPYRPAHFHYMVTHPGYRTLITQVFADDDEHLDSDVTFSVVRSLIGRFHKHEAGRKPDEDVTAPWYTLDYNLYLEPGEMRIPAPSIP